MLQYIAHAFTTTLTHTNSQTMKYPQIENFVPHRLRILSNTSVSHHRAHTHTHTHIHTHTHTKQTYTHEHTQNTYTQARIYQLTEALLSDRLRMAGASSGRAFLSMALPMARASLPSSVYLCVCVCVCVCACVCACA
jgi:hypothetical protein